MTSGDEQVPDVAFVPPVDFDDEEQLRALLDRLVQRRKELGLTQPDIAKAFGSRTNRIDNVEKGSGGQVRVRSLQRYARTVGLRLRLDLVLDTERSTVDGRTVDGQR